MCSRRSGPKVNKSACTTEPGLACTTEPDSRVHNRCTARMKDHLEKNFLAKKWSIRTTDCDFHRHFHAKVCPKNHQHTYIQGIETSRSAYYPWRMVLAIARCWRDQLLPPRFHRWAHSKNENHGAHLALELAVQEDGDPHALPAHPPSDPGQASARPEPHALPPDEPRTQS